jgi:hypothetical protein
MAQFVEIGQVVMFPALEVRQGGHFHHIEDGVVGWLAAAQFVGVGSQDGFANIYPGGLFGFVAAEHSGVEALDVQHVEDPVFVHEWHYLFCFLSRVHPLAVGVEKQHFPKIDGKRFCPLADAVSGVADLLEGGETWYVKTCQNKSIDARVNVTAEMVAGCAHLDAVPSAPPRHNTFFQLGDDAGGHFLEFIG